MDELLRSFASLRDALRTLGPDELIGAVVSLDPRGRRELRRSPSCAAVDARSTVEPPEQRQPRA